MNDKQSLGWGGISAKHWNLNLNASRACMFVNWYSPFQLKGCKLCADKQRQQRPGGVISVPVEKSIEKLIKQRWTDELRPTRDLASKQYGFGAGNSQLMWRRSGLNGETGRYPQWLPLTNGASCDARCKHYIRIGQVVQYAHRKLFPYLRWPFADIEGLFKGPLFALGNVRRTG